MRILHIDPDAPDAQSIAAAAEALKAGGLVAFPTETVYGLGANALDANAVARIFAAKGRPSTDPVIVHLADSGDLPLVARDVPPSAHMLAERFWPGPLTLILWKQNSVPADVTARLQTVAVRVPAHPIAHALIDKAGIPVAAPSANRFSRPSPTRAAHVATDLGDAIDILIDGGPTPIGVESTILDLTVTPPVVRRPGGVSFEQLATVIPAVRRVDEVWPAAQAQPSPGQLLRHYAPAATTTLYVGTMVDVVERIGDDIRRAVASGTRVGVLAPEEDLMALAPRLAAVGAVGRVLTRRYGSRADREQAARDLFAALRDLDSEGVDVIYAIAPGGDGIDTAIVDRLTRAAEGRVVRVR